MGSPVARVGDMCVGTCDGPGHPKAREFVGTFISGSETAFADGIPIICVGHVGQTDCGHTIIAQTGSDVWAIDGAPVHRQGDVVIVVEGGVGVTINGSEIISSE